MHFKTILFYKKTVWMSIYSPFRNVKENKWKIYVIILKEALEKVDERIENNNRVCTCREGIRRIYMKKTLAIMDRKGGRS